MLFDESTLRKLNQLTLVASRVRAGAMKGDRRSSRRGNSIEFADYRDYTPGDDLRRLDWNIYARLERPFIKLLEEEEDLAVHILLDGSRSMDWAVGDEHKFTYAKRLTAALGAVALSTGDAVTIGFLQDSRVADEFGPKRGANSMARMFRFLENLQANGETNLNQSMLEYAIKARRPGVVILISDLFSPVGYESGLRNLLGRGHEALILHVLSQDEIDSPLSGDVQLLDIETNQTQDISLDGNLHDLYRTRVQQWTAEIKTIARKQGVRYLQATTDKAWDQLVLLELRKAGVVK